MGGRLLQHAVRAGRALVRPLQEVNDLRATVERAKNDIIKTVIGVLGTFSAVAFTISRLMTIS